MSDEEEDYVGPGADGQAAVRRPHRIVEVADPDKAGTTVGRSKVSVRRYLETSTLDWYVNRGYIDQDQHRSGIRFRRLWLASYAEGGGVAGYAPRIASNRATGSKRLATSRLLAQDECSNLLAMMTPPLASVVVDVCGNDRRATGRLGALRNALDVLTQEFQHEDKQRGKF